MIERPDDWLFSMNFLPASEAKAIETYVDHLEQQVEFWKQHAAKVQERADALQKEMRIRSAIRQLNAAFDLRQSQREYDEACWVAQEDSAERENKAALEALGALAKAKELKDSA